MKKFKRAILTLACLLVIFGTVACGNTGGTNDNMTNDRNNDVTEGTDRNNDTNDGVINDVGDAVGDGIEDVGEGVKDITDGTDNTTNNNR